MVFTRTTCDTIRPELNAQADRFRAITLTEMNGVKLMNRTDTKFVLPLSQLRGLLTQLSETYQWLEDDGHRLCAYETLYFGTTTTRPGGSTV